MLWNGVLATTIATLLATAAPAAADTFTVTSPEDVRGTCAQPPACASIRQAINSAHQTNGPDTVNIPAGEYHLALGALLIANDASGISLVGASARTTILYGTSSSRVIEIDTASATIAHLTARLGTATAGDSPYAFFGGNIRAYKGNVLIDHVRATEGSAYSGGGIANRNGSMVIQHSLIDHNAADNGGADGGGIINFGGDGLGAASLVIRNSTVAFNFASKVGAITQYGNNLDTIGLESVTVAFNSAGSDGGGLTIGQGTGSVRNSLLAHNTSASNPFNCAGTTPSSFGANVVDDVSCNLNGPTDRFSANTGLSDGLSNMGGETDVLPFAPTSAVTDVGGSCSATDQTDAPRPTGASCDAGAWELRGATIVSGPQGMTNDPTPTFTFAGLAPYACSIDPVQLAQTECQSPYTTSALADGTYTFHAYAEDGTSDSRTFTVDTVAPTAPSVSGEGGNFSFEGEREAGLECSLDGAPFTACSSPYAAAGLAPGQHVLAIRAVDAAGNVGAATTRTFSVGGQPPVQTPTPTPAPTATPTPAPPLEPVRNRSVAVEPEGTVLIKRNGKFVPLTDGVVPNGSEIDAKHGSVKITTSSGEVAVFFGGRFKISQRGGITTLTLSEPLDCRKANGKAAAAAKKPKTRKLWGDGKGKFRTKGQYSAATVRGTRWLVQDTCTTTLTRVAQGVVSVRDAVKKKTFILRKGKSYTARAKKK